MLIDSNRCQVAKITHQSRHFVAEGFEGVLRERIPLRLQSHLCEKDKHLQGRKNMHHEALKNIVGEITNPERAIRVRSSLSTSLEIFGVPIHGFLAGPLC